MDDPKRIIAVEPGSIAAALGIRPGSRLLAVDGEPVPDVFAWRLALLAPVYVLTIEEPDGSLIEYEIEADEDEEIGLVFAEALMDHCRRCQNRCVFCFIDQLPPHLRDTLYFKDDDLRLSFLTGNYVTLTNVSDAELDRLIRARLSPMNVSVHTTDPELRVRLMRNPRAARIMEQLRRIVAGGIQLNVQLVLCPGLNDGPALERTLGDLATLGPHLQSIAAVPVDLTRYRESLGLPHLEPYTPALAAAVVDVCERWQARFLDSHQSRLFYLGDEFYLRAGRPLPPPEDYEDYPQLENGVGLLTSFAADLEETLSELEPRPARNPRTLVLPVGVDAASFLAGWSRQIAACFPGLKLQTLAVENRFFGPQITVTGLVTGGDLLAAVAESEIPPDAVLLIPDVMLRAGESLFLDDLSVADIARRSGLGTRIAGSRAADLVATIQALAAERP
ncbi:MAG: DUF512 domain-containing protein [Bacillota bacterium]|nr:DUF512 domain-containing protein [Bacillota bacterium]